jgi:two-component system alkaline phosphatase synthesis response regulator PhoP
MAVKDELEFEGFEVETFSDGALGLTSVLNNAPDLLILDLMLPGRNGFEICREIRQKGIQVPIIMLTARTQEVDRVRGLDLGADDYITKPFSLAELLARIRAVLRRSEQRKSRQERECLLTIGNLTIDTKKHTVYKGGEEIILTHKEFQMLKLLMHRRGEVISREEFLDTVWGEDVYITQRTVDTHMASLRRKIEDRADKPVYILSVRGTGYKLNEKPTVS